MASILIVSPVPTHPASAGNRARVASLVDLLRQLGHRVYFMHVRQEAGDDQRMRASLGDAYLPVDYDMSRSRWRSLRRRIARKLGHPSMHNLGIDEWYDPALDEHLDSFFNTHDVDAVIVEYVFFSRALLRVPASVRKIIDTHDVFTDRYRRYVDHGLAPTWYSCSAREEARGLARADALIAIQSSEATHFRQLIDRPVAVVGHAVRLQALPAEAVVPGRILFIASGSTINLAAFDWMKNAILPRIRAACPDAELAVGGTISRQVEPAPGIRILGLVDDLADAYATAEVVVNPVQLGTGLKIKSVESLGFGRPLVTTPCGAEGLEDGAGDAFLMASTAEQLADDVVRLLTDPATAARIAAAGSTYATRFNRTVAEELLRLIPASR